MRRGKNQDQRALYFLFSFLIPFLFLFCFLVESDGQQMRRRLTILCLRDIPASSFCLSSFLVPSSNSLNPPPPHTS